MDTRLSRCMARILRHDTKGQHDEAGYMYVRDLLSRREISEYTEEDVKRVVENDSKTRFHLTCDEHGTLKVKATQGHTIGGLSRMKRDHIHFCEAETDVISGFPPGCDVVISIDLQKALNDEIKFFQSENKVILSPGNVNGIIPTKYFNDVYERHTGQRLPF